MKNFLLMLIQKIKALPRRTLITASLIILVIAGGIIAIILHRGSADELTDLEEAVIADATGILHEGDNAFYVDMDNLVRGPEDPVNIFLGYGVGRKKVNDENFESLVEYEPPPAGIFDDETNNGKNGLLNTSGFYFADNQEVAGSYGWENYNFNLASLAKEKLPSYCVYQYDREGNSTVNDDDKFTNEDCDVILDANQAPRLDTIDVKTDYNNKTATIYGQTRSPGVPYANPKIKKVILVYWVKDHKEDEGDIVTAEPNSDSFSIQLKNLKQNTPYEYKLGLIREDSSSGNIATITKDYGFQLKDQPSGGGGGSNASDDFGWLVSRGLGKDCQGNAGSGSEQGIIKLYVGVWGYANDSYQQKAKVSGTLHLEYGFMGKDDDKSDPVQLDGKTIGYIAHPKLEKDIPIDLSSGSAEITIDGLYAAERYSYFGKFVGNNGFTDYIAQFHPAPDGDTATCGPLYDATDPEFAKELKQNKLPTTLTFHSTGDSAPLAYGVDPYLAIDKSDTPTCLNTPQRGAVFVTSFAACEKVNWYQPTEASAHKLVATLRTDQSVPAEIPVGKNVTVWWLEGFDFPSRNSYRQNIFPNGTGYENIWVVSYPPWKKEPTPENNPHYYQWVFWPPAQATQPTPTPTKSNAL